MEQKIAVIGIILIFLLVSVSVFYAKSSVLDNESTLTKAVCNEKNYCEDYEINCKGNDVTRLTPTGAVVQFSDNWQDPRTQEDKIIACN